MQKRTVVIQPVVAVIFASIGPDAFSATLTTGKDEQSLLPYWQVQDDGLMLRLVQRLPDQTRGFFMGRKFSPAHAEKIATSCVFQTVFKNISDQGKPSPLTYNLRDWVIHYQGTTRHLKTREDWEREWAETDARQSSKMDFYWSLIPTTMTYEPGDYNWGMSIFDLKPGARFDLTISWQQFEKPHSYKIKNIECSPDIHPDPSDFGKPTFE